MIKLKDFLKVADDQVVIINGCDDVVLINDSYFNADLLSEKLLNSEIDAVGSSDSKIVIRLKGGVLDD